MNIKNKSFHNIYFNSRVFSTFHYQRMRGKRCQIQKCDKVMHQGCTKQSKKRQKNEIMKRLQRILILSFNTTFYTSNSKNKRTNLCVRERERMCVCVWEREIESRKSLSIFKTYSLWYYFNCVQWIIWQTFYIFANSAKIKHLFYFSIGLKLSFYFCQSTKISLFSPSLTFFYFFLQKCQNYFQLADAWQWKPNSRRKKLELVYFTCRHYLFWPSYKPFARRGVPWKLVFCLSLCTDRQNWKKQCLTDVFATRSSVSSLRDNSESSETNSPLVLKSTFTHTGGFLEENRCTTTSVRPCEF